MFDRQGRKVALTTSGEYFLVYAKRLLATLKDADDAMARFRKLETGLLTVGMVSTAKYFVPRLLTRFRVEHPGIEVRLQVCQNREQLVTPDGQWRGGPGHHGPPAARAGHPGRALCSPPACVCRASGPPAGARRPRPPVAALADHALIVREAASGTRALMDRFFLEHRVEPRIAMEMPSNETIKQAVMAGMGISFLSLHTLGLELRAGEIELVQVEGTPVMRLWNVVHLQSRVLSPAAEAFRYFILEEGEAYLAEHDRPWLGGGTPRDL